MSRKTKTGLDTFPLDCRVFENKKLKLLHNDHGHIGVLIWLKILAYAYANTGYFFDLNESDEVEIYVGDECKTTMHDFNEVVQSCLKRKLFMKNVFDDFNVLTCEDMQDTYLFATGERRRKGTIVRINERFLHSRIYVKKYSSPENIHLFRGINGIDPLNDGENPDKNLHSIGYNSIGKESESRGEQKKTPTPVVLDEKKGVENTLIAGPKFSQVLQFFEDTLKAYGKDAGFVKMSAQKFFNNYDSKGWEVNGEKILKWEAKARNWIIDDLQGRADRK